MLWATPDMYILGYASLLLSHHGPCVCLVTMDRAPFISAALTSILLLLLSLSRDPVPLGSECKHLHCRPLHHL